MTRWKVVRALLGAGLAALAAVAYAPGFGRTPEVALSDPRFAASTAGAAATILATCLLLALTTRTSPVIRVAAATLTLTTYVLLVVAPGRVLLLGPKRLLTTALPIEPAGAELATVVAVVGLAALGAVEPALRRRASLLPLVAPLVAAGAGLAVTASAGPPPWWLAPGYALGAAGLLLAARRDRVTAAPWPLPASPLRAGLTAGRVLAVLGGLAVAALLGPSLLGWAGAGAPADARDLVPQPVTPRQTTTPLQLFPALRNGSQPLHFTVYADQKPDRLRYVSLDRFNGEFWTTSARYLRAGRQLPLGPRPTAKSETRQERIRITRPGPLGWLVCSGRPTEVSVSGVGVNERSGDVVFPAGPLPTEYAVTSVLTTPTEAQLLAGTPATYPAEATGARLPDELVSQANTAIGGEYGYPALVRLAEHFTAEDSGFVTDTGTAPPSGHGLFQLQRLFDTKRGTAEQYASAYAVMARSLGYHARVVVGFDVPEGDGDGWKVTGRDVTAWAEVEFTELGWVAFDPTPRRTATGAGPPPSPEPSQQPDTSASSATPTPPVQLPPPADNRSLAARATVTLLPVIVALGSLLVGYAFAIPFWKARRRRRRRTAPDPDRRALGAWRDTVERLAESGLPIAASDTSVQVAGAAYHRFGETPGEPVRRLATLRDRAAYAAGTLSASAADGAWLQADLARRALRAGARPLRRLRALLDPRPLFRPYPPTVSNPKTSGAKR